MNKKIPELYLAIDASKFEIEIQSAKEIKSAWEGDVSLLPFPCMADLSSSRYKVPAEICAAMAARFFRDGNPYPHLFTSQQILIIGSAANEIQNQIRASTRRSAICLTIATKIHDHKSLQSPF